MRPALAKLLLFLAALLLITVGYGGAQLLAPTGAPIGTAVDEAIPFVPVFVVPYVLYFPFILVPWLLLWRKPAEYRLMALCFIATLAVSVAIYLVWQTSAPRAAPAVADGFTWLIDQVYRTDKNLNAFPSLHTSLSLLTALFVWRSRSAAARVRARGLPRLGFAAAVLAVLIIASTVLTKQHGIVDVVGGLALGGVVYVFVTRRVTGAARRRSDALRGTAARARRGWGRCLLTRRPARA